MSDTTDGPPKDGKVRILHCAVPFRWIYNDPNSKAAKAEIYGRWQFHGLKRGEWFDYEADHPIYERHVAWSEDADDKTFAAAPIMLDTLRYIAERSNDQRVRRKALAAIAAAEGK